MAGERLDQHVDVIWHDDPREEPIADIVEVEEGLLDESRGPRVPEQASSMARIESLLDALASLPSDAPLGLARQVCFELLEHSNRQAVRQAIGHVLNGLRGIEVRHVSPRVPALGGCAVEVWGSGRAHASRTNGSVGGFGERAKRR